MLKNTTSPRLYPLTILAIITFFIQLVLSLMMVQKAIRYKEFVTVTIILLVCLLVMGFVFEMIDGWLVEYERKRYAEYIHSIDQHDVLFEKLLYHQAYEAYKRKLLKDDRYKRILMTTVDIARAKNEIHEGILKEAIAMLNKPEVQQEQQEKPSEITIPSVTPIDMFLKKHRKSDKNQTNDSIKRAADIFLNDKEQNG
jgi:ABC-type transport system involved in cytochrome bd biosynthesis fused ATPase/permease subunit